MGAAGIHRPKGIGDPLEFVAFTLATEKHREICTALMFAIPASLLALEFPDIFECDAPFIRVCPLRASRCPE